MSVRVIAYTYESDVHCPACAKERFKTQGLAGVANDELDEHWLRLDLIDRDGNPIHPVFTTDERNLTHCGNCGEEF